jgi:glycosyltransferase involved in cell wall biosynthesis
MVRDLLPVDSRIRYFPLTEKLTIGAKRNYACQQARGTIIVHWDDDDWYAQNRVRAQVDFLLNSKTDITGTSRLYYFDVVSGQAYLFQCDDASHPWVAGNTLAYRRSYWQGNPFPDIQISEDFQFVWAAPPDSVKDTKSLKLVIGCLHRGNVSPKNTAAGFWQPASASLVRAIIREVATPEALSRELVSCIMPTFNRRPFVPLALQCFRSQTYPHKELIVVDDGSDPVADLLDSVPDVRYLRVSHRLTIGAKRNLACREARGEIIAHLDDDDWYAPDRLEYQIAPLLAGAAELTGLTSRFVLQLPACRFWTVSEDLHRQMFVGNVHGGTLVYWRSILREGLQYPDTNLAEDAALIRDAASRGRQLLRLENPGVFVYLRHGHNAWRFDPGHLVDPAGWSSVHAPPSLPPQLVDAYRVASESMQAYVREIANAH